MEAIILLGAPGSGKGTAAEKIRELTGYVHTATGDILRDAVKRETDIGREAEAFMKRGELVPDELIIRLINERLDNSDVNGLFMFDGFPRTMAQVELLEQSYKARGGRITHVFFLDAPRDVLIQRLSGRRICRKCGVNYHIINLKPKKERICDICGGELYQRNDDQEKTIINRLEVFNKQTEGLISYYRKQGILVRIDTDRPVNEMVADIIGLLKKHDHHKKRIGS